MRKIRLPKRLLSGLLAGALLLTPAMAFTDTAGHWAEGAVNKWSQEYGVLQGYDDGSFKPDASITRGLSPGFWTASSNSSPPPPPGPSPTPRGTAGRTPF